MYILLFDNALFDIKMFFYCSYFLRYTINNVELLPARTWSSNSIKQLHKMIHLTSENIIKGKVYSDSICCENVALPSHNILCSGKRSLITKLAPKMMI